MDHFEEREMWVLRSDGTAEYSTLSNTVKSPPWGPQVVAALDACGEECLALQDSVRCYMARRLVRRGGIDSEPRTLVVVWARPAWIAEADLTPRQRQVCEYAAAGAKSIEIAAHLAISLNTVRSHLKAAYRELGVCNRVELARALSMLGPSMPHSSSLVEGRL